MQRERAAGLSHPRSRRASDAPSQFHRFDFRKRVAYDDDAKRRFHLYARQQLRRLADALGLPSGTFDLRNNEGGIAVSGEVTLHADHLYVQACQPATGHDTGFLVRTL